MEEIDKKIQEVAKQPEQVEPPVSGIIDAANKAAERLEKANIEHKALLDRQEKMQAMAMLGGRSEAGTTAPKPVEETPKDYVKKVMSGQL